MSNHLYVDKSTVENAQSSRDLPVRVRHLPYQPAVEQWPTTAPKPMSDRNPEEDE